MSATVPQPSDVVKLPMSMGDVHTVSVDGNPYVVFRPAVEDLGLTFSPQLQKLQRRSWATMLSFDTVAEDGKIRQMVCVDVRTFLMWAATVPENRVRGNALERLVAYQNETADVVAAYWTQGGAVNPRATAEQLEDLRERARGWDILAGEGSDYSVREAAAILNRDHDIITGQNTLFAYMRRCRMLDMNNRPYAKHKHHLVRRMGVEYRDEFGQLRIGGSQVRVTGEGMAYLHRSLSRPSGAV